MSDWSGIFLGIIAVATLVMALIQVGAIIAVLKIAKQAHEFLTASESYRTALYTSRIEYTTVSRRCPSGIRICRRRMPS